VLGFFMKCPQRLAWRREFSYPISNWNAALMFICFIPEHTVEAIFNTFLEVSELPVVHFAR
jgi:hypothetical protein